MWNKMNNRHCIIQLTFVAESKTKPVLGALKDQVLFVKHNLNMQAIGSIKQEATLIEQDVSALIKEMEASISEAESFINSIRS